MNPRDREVLDHSLRRRVPDEDLAAILGVESPEVARLRAGAVERLSNELGVKGGEDLGHLLKELLDAQTWEMLPAEEPTPATPPAAREPAAELPDEEPSFVEEAPPPPPAEEHPPVGASDGPPSAVDRPREPPPEPQREPVLSMLNEPRPSEASHRAPRRRGGGRRVAMGAAVLLAVLAPAGVVAALTTRDTGGDDDANRAEGTRPFAPERESVADPFPSDPKSASRYPVAYLRGRTQLYDRPDGKPKLRVSAKTDWNSPRILSVVQRQGNWLAVLTPELKNGEVGWVKDTAVARLAAVTYAIHADLSRREVTIRRNGASVRTFKVGVGRPEYRTPPGRYAVTDKLRVNASGSPYGCCVLALTGHQTRLPRGWPGGDRLALHATQDTGGLGKAVSLGCMRADTGDARWMMKNIPLGSPVFVSE